MSTKINKGKFVYKNQDSLRLRFASGLRSFLKPENNHEISNI